jgi:hypothetical protein
MNLPPAGTRVEVTYWESRKRNSWTEDRVGFVVGTVESRKGTLWLKDVVDPRWPSRIRISRGDIVNVREVK